MSGGGDKQATQTQTTQVKLPEWVENASQQNYQKAQQITSKPYQAYDGERVAPLSDPTMSAINYMLGNVGAYQGNFDAASGALAGLLNFNYSPDTIKAGKVTDADIDSYINPYIANVENKALDNLERSRLAAVNSNASKAAAAKSFGGSRHGVIDAVTNAETSRAAGDLSANLRKSGFDTATGLITSDMNRDLSAQTSNAGNRLAAALQGAGVRNNAATGIANVAQAGQAGVMADISGLLNAGGLIEGKQQQFMDQDYADWREAKDYDLEQLNILMAALGMSPYGRTETSTTTSTQPKQGTDWATAALGGLSLLKGLGAFASEDDLKTDIEKIGKLPGSDLNVYAYRYKNDPKTYPKVVGLMASDVEKKRPGKTKRIGKNRVVDYAGAIGG